MRIYNLRLEKKTEEVNQLDSEMYNEINQVLNNIRLPYLRTIPQEIRPSDIQKLRERNIYKKSANVIEIHIKGKKHLAKMMYTMYLGDFISCYLAILRKIDPTPVDAIMELKNELAKI